MNAEWTPIDHRPPLPRIETSPRYTPAPVEMMPDHIQQQLDHMHEIMRAKEASRVWQTIVDAARI